MICSSTDVVRISVLVSSELKRGSATPLTTTSSSPFGAAAANDELNSGSVKALKAITVANALEEGARVLIKDLTSEVLDSRYITQACAVNSARFVFVYSSLVFMGESYSRAPLLQCPA